MVDGHSFRLFIVLPSEVNEEFLLVPTIIIYRSCPETGVLILVPFYLLSLSCTTWSIEWFC